MISSSCSTTTTVLPNCCSWRKTCISLVRVAAVKSDARFVQNVETAHKTASQGSCQIDTLAFTAGQRIAEAVQGEVSQSLHPAGSGCGC